MRVPALVVDLVGPLGVSLAMGGVMSAAMTAINSGLGPHFWTAWLRGWAVGALVGVPAGAVIVPATMRLQAYLRKKSA